MTKKFTRASLLAIALASAAGAASAQGDLSANVAVTNDYVWRGISQTDNNFAVQGGLDYTNGGFYVGGWASNVDFGTDADIEVDLYGGYIYPGEDDLDFLEVKAGLGYTVDALSAGVTAYYDPDNENTYVEGTGTYAFTEKFKGLASVGNYSFDAGGDYTNWSLGATYSFDLFDLTGKYTDTDIDGAGDIADENFVIMVSKVF
jgi:predicted porin